MNRVIVIGGGAAGMMAALTAAENGSSTVLLEHNEKLGRKIYITGKGRCNFTNACDINTFTGNVVSNPRFMYSSLRAFTPEDMIAFLEAAGCRTKVERGNRAFPASDHASDVTAALQRLLKQQGVDIRLNTEVTGIDIIAEPANNHDQAARGGRFAVSAKDVRTGKRLVLGADKLIIATGGLSYASTGSTGDGLRFASELGLSVRECVPALIPLNIAEEAECRDMQGVSLKNVSISIIRDNGKCIYESETGEMLFTHFGVSGPVVLSASSIVTGSLNKGERLILEIDLKPALTAEQLDKRLLRDFEETKNADIQNALGKLLIASLRPAVLRRAGIAPHKKVRDISRNDRAAIIKAVKHLDFTITGTRDFNEAIITQGGVSVREINPSTMEAKKVPGLYFAGEVLDVDAFTGGFNLQIAWSTGRAAGLAAARA